VKKSRGGGNQCGIIGARRLSAMAYQLQCRLSWLIMPAAGNGGVSESSSGQAKKWHLLSMANGVAGNNPSAAA